MDGSKFLMFMHWVKSLELRVEMRPNLEAFIKMKSDLYIFKDSD